MELPGEDALIYRDGPKLVIEPSPPSTLLGMLATLSPIEEDFPTCDELELDSVDL